MPKETIHDAATTYDTQIVWAREPAGHVQIGVVPASGQTLVQQLIIPTLTERMDMQASSSEREQRDKNLRTTLEEIEFTGVWGTLDREGCNRLIRVLRRARDQAFGADA